MQAPSLPRNDSPQARRPAILWLAAILIVYLAHVVYLNCVAEDSFIAFRFARNLAGGFGLVWNPGEAPVEGYTNLLWVVLCAAAMKAGLDAPLFAQVLGALSGATALLMVFAAGRLTAGWSTGAALVAPLMLAVSGPFATWAGSGMETSLFAALVFAGLWAFADYWRTGRRGLMAAAGVLLCAASLARPEGVMVFGVLAGLGGFLSWGEWRRRLADHLVAAACFGIPFGVYFAWRYAYFGYPLPNTFYAKTGGGVDQLVRGLLLTSQFGFQFVTPLVPWALVALWEHGVPAIRRPVAACAAALRAHALVAGSVALFTVYTAYIVAVGNDYMAMHRFFVPLLAPMYVAAAGSLAPLWPRFAPRRSRRAVVALLVVTAAAGTIYHSTRYEKHFVSKPAQQHGNYQGVQIERWHVARLTLIGRFFSGYRTTADESLATSAIGAIGYYADMKVYDFNGLVDIHIARAPIAANKLKGRAGHQKADYPYVLAKKPTYLMFSRELTPEAGDIRRFVPAGVWPLVEPDYEVCSVWMSDEVNDQAGFFTFLRRRAAAGSRPPQPCEGR